MSLVRKLASETAVYGLSSIVGRMLGFLLAPLYTILLPKHEYGHVTELMSYAAFLMVVFTYRMEIAYFRFGAVEKDKKLSYSTALLSILISSIVLYAGILFFSRDIADALLYNDHVEYIIYIGMILAFDALSEIPFARLRLENKPWRFASIRLINIGVNLFFNCFFLIICPAILNYSHSELMRELILTFYKPGFGVGYILLSQTLASGLTVLMLIPYYRDIPLQFDWKMWRNMLTYSWPLIIVGFAGVANETLDRALMKWLLPGTQIQNDAQVGIYGACYKLTMILTLFTQAYRYSAEPFFLKQAAEGQSRHIYAQTTKYFLLVASIGLLVTYLYLDIIKLLIAAPYREGIGIIPILLFANLFLGLYYNMSIWYKITDKTIIATYISVFGALITVVGNLILIPMIGYMGAAWSTFACYLSMLVICYVVGQRYYPIPYQVRYLSFFILLAALICLINGFLVQRIPMLWLRLLLNTGLLSGFLVFIYQMEKDKIKNALKRKVSDSGSTPA